MSTWLTSSRRSKVDFTNAVVRLFLGDKFLGMELIDVPQNQENHFLRWSACQMQDAEDKLQNPEAGVDGIGNFPVDQSKSYSGAIRVGFWSNLI